MSWVRYPSVSSSACESVPFDTIEDAWFWFIQANEARQAGARIVAGLGAPAAARAVP